MLKDLCLYHRRKPHGSSSVPGLTWETCLRSITLVSPEVPALINAVDGEVFREGDAYRFLLEIICGLHSPILGETEVFGQFKVFAKQWVKAEPHKASLVQRLFADAKAIRTRHLAHLGSQSYGGWLKKNVRENTVHILGAGQLAREILPYLVKAGKSVTVHVREPARAAFPGIEVRNLKDQKFSGGALIVAAPLKASDIEAWYIQPPARIYDLRDNSSEDALPGSQNVVLKDIFGQIESTKVRLKPVVEKVKAEISHLTYRLASEVQVRPQGWDDICA